MEYETGTIGNEGCACGEVICDEYRIETHCHRTGSCCPYAGVHYSNDKGLEHAKFLKQMIENDYRADVTLVKNI